ncbi:MAG: hypothetical protein P8011_11505 [Acidihalobacter sp.]
MSGLFSTIKGRLTLAVVVTTVLTCAAIGTTFFHNDRVRVQFDQQATYLMPLVKALDTLTRAGLEEGALLREQLLTAGADAAGFAERPGHGCVGPAFQRG